MEFGLHTSTNCQNKQLINVYGQGNVHVHVHVHIHVHVHVHVHAHEHEHVHVHVQDGNGSSLSMNILREMRIEVRPFAEHGEACLEAVGRLPPPRVINL